MQGEVNEIDIPQENVIRSIHDPYPLLEIPGRGRAKRECTQIIQHTKCDNPNCGCQSVHTQTCMRRYCPVCYRSAAARQANRALTQVAGKQIALFQAKVTPFHLSHYTLSPPQQLYDDRFATRSRVCCKVLLRYSMDETLALIEEHSSIPPGGVIAFHPYRWDPDWTTWVRGPHYHIVGSVRFEMPTFYYETGWVFKYISTLSQDGAPFRCLRYEFGHAAFLDKSTLPTYKMFGWASRGRKKWEVGEEVKTWTSLPCKCGGTVRDDAGDAILFKTREKRYTPSKELLDSLRGDPGDF